MRAMLSKKCNRIQGIYHEHFQHYGRNFLAFFDSMVNISAIGYTYQNSGAPVIFTVLPLYTKNDYLQILTIWLYIILGTCSQSLIQKNINTKKFVTASNQIQNCLGSFNVIHPVKCFLVSCCRELRFRC